jgi:hypothetical protein
VDSGGKNLARGAEDPDPARLPGRSWSRLGESNPRPTHYEAGRERFTSVRGGPACTSGAGRVEPEPLRTAPNCYPNCSRGGVSTAPGRAADPCAGFIRLSANLPVARANSPHTEGTRESRSVPVPWLGSLALGPALPPVPLVLAALLVGAVGARVALAPSRSDAVGALAASVETWIILGRGGPASPRKRPTRLLPPSKMAIGNRTANGIRKFLVRVFSVLRLDGKREFNLPGAPGIPLTT